MPDQWLPDIVICTESWLTPDIYDAEIITSSLGYTMFRRDRGSRRGDVFILVRNLCNAIRVQEWETDCEILWIKLQLAGSAPSTLLPIINKVSRTQRVSKNLKGQLQWCQLLRATHGYWEILTSPSFAGQIISPPFPLTVSTHTSMRSSRTT